MVASVDFFFYRTANKYEFIKAQYLGNFKNLAIYRIYLYIAQIYSRTRDDRIENIYSVLIFEAADWREADQNVMLKTEDFLNKILLTREITERIYRRKEHSHRLKLIRR